jgi:hypothetical protein
MASVLCDMSRECRIENCVRYAKRNNMCLRHYRVQKYRYALYMKRLHAIEMLRQQGFFSLPLHPPPQGSDDDDMDSLDMKDPCTLFDERVPITSSPKRIGQSTMSRVLATTVNKYGKSPAQPGTTGMCSLNTRMVLRERLRLREMTNSMMA